MRFADLRDNPVLRSEALRLRRRWVESLSLILLGWLPIAWVVRMWLDSMMLATTAWQEFLRSSAYYAMRPDVLVAFFLVWRSASSRQWHAVRAELAVTLLTPVQIVAGKAVIPVVVLATLNVFATPAYYGRMVMETEMYLPFFNTGGWFATGAFIATFALLEDFMFAAVAVLIAMREFLFARDAMLSTFRAILRVLVFGVVINLASWVTGFVFLALPWSILRHMVKWPGLEMLVSNGLFFAVVLPLEWFLIRRLYAGIRRHMPEWLEAED